MGKLYPESRVEIEGILAKHYGFLLNLVTAGRYKHFIQKAVEDMKIRPSDKILDLGAGSGYNAEFMCKYMGKEGYILGLEIGETAIRRFNNRFEGIDKVQIEKRRIDKPIPYENVFDKVFASFVFHGLPHSSRLKLLDNAHNALKKNGTLLILDYGKFEVATLPFYFKIPFKALECKYAFDYLKRDWDNIFRQHRFEVTGRNTYFNNFAQLLSARKV